MAGLVAGLLGARRLGVRAAWILVASGAAALALAGLTFWLATLSVVDSYLAGLALALLVPTAAFLLGVGIAGVALRRRAGGAPG